MAKVDIALAKKMGKILKKVSSFPSGYIDDGVFGHILGGSPHIRINRGIVTAEEAKIYADGTDQSARINYVYGLSRVKMILFDYDGGANVVVSGTVTIPAGKFMKFRPGNMIETTGSGVLNGGIVECDDASQVFAGTQNVFPEGFSKGYAPAAAWGFLPNTGTNMTAKIQKAVDYVKYSATTTLIKVCVKGTYYVNNLVIAKYGGGNALACTCSIEGLSPSLSEGVIFHNDNLNGATIHIQNGYGCDITNIIFSGIGPDVPNYITSVDATWRVAVGGGAIRANRKSPGQTAVSIDNFLNESVGQGTIESSADYYPGMEEYYTNTTTGGSTNIRLKNCSYTRMYVGVLQGVSGVANGEGVHVEGGFGIYVAWPWIAGQLQSRENTISSFYFIFGYTFVANKDWGTGVGDIPYVAGNINYVKYLSATYGNFTSPRFSVYGEGIWSLGIHEGNTPISYDKFNITRAQNTIIPGEVVGQAPVFLQSLGPVTFTKGVLLGGDYSAGIPFNCQKVDFDSCYIEGGLPFNTNPSTYTDNIKFTNVQNFHGAGGAIRRLDEGRNEVMLDAGVYSNKSLSYLLPGGKFKDLASRTFEMVGDMFDKIPVNQSIYVGNVVAVNNTAKTLTFTALVPGLFDAGDVIYTPDLVNNTGDDFSASGTTLGYVTNVSGTTVTLSHIPAGVTNGGTYLMYILRIPRFVNHTLGTVTSGQNTITNVISDTGGFVQGDRIKGVGIPLGSYVTDVSGSTITISTNATSSGTLVELSDAKMRVTADDVPFIYFGGEYNYDNLEVIWFRGDELRNVSNAIGGRGRYCVAPGKVLSVTPPTWFKEDEVNFLGYRNDEARLRVGSFNFQALTINGSGLAENIYHNGTNWVRRDAGYGSVMYIDSDAIEFHSAPNGAAGSVATLSLLMRLKPGEGPTLPTQAGTGTVPAMFDATGQLIRGSAGGGSGIDLELAATRAAVSASTTPRWVRIAADEDNNGDKTLNLHNGTTLEFIQIIP